MQLTDACTVKIEILWEMLVGMFWPTEYLTYKHLFGGEMLEVTCLINFNCTSITAASI
jgi:hypothetical protein